MIKWTRTHLNRMSSLGTNDKSILVKWCIDEFSSCKYLSFLLLIIISVRYLLLVTAFILLVYTCLFSSIVKTSKVCLVHLNPFLEPTSAKQQEGNVSCSMKQREPLMGLELTTDRYPPITSQTRYPLHHDYIKRLVCYKTPALYIYSEIGEFY